ncbi:MAG: hypothetical protein LBR25_00345 [Erysipelotrichaceae bacterium]|jgi:hypothetical protein|nr:hypothetical protein [Erysipelotrichaceae bacterium]
MHLQYQLTPADYLSYYQQILLNDKQMRQSRIKMALWGVVLPLSLLVVLRLSLWWWIGGCVFMVLWVFVISRWLYTDLLNKVIKDHIKNSSIVDKVELELKQESLKVNRQSTKIKNYYVLLDMIVLYLANEEMILIPQRELSEETGFLRKLVSLLEQQTIS